MVEKAVHVKQGDLRDGTRAEFMLPVKEPKSRERQRRSQSPHRSEEAPVMGVEQRGAGRWKP